MNAALPVPPLPTLDHVGFVGADLAALVATMQRLGFCTTEPRELMRTDAASGATVPLQQQSCHAVFDTGYIELSAVTSDDPAHHLATYRARGDGLHILALGSVDPDADWRRCEAAGLPCTRPAGAARQIAYGSRHGEARFRWFMLEPRASPEGLLCFARNENPELVFQPEVTRHANGSVALCEVVLQSATPRDTAMRLARVTGAGPRAIDGAVGESLRLDLADAGALALLTPAAMLARFGAAAAGLPNERFVALQLRVRRLADTAAWLASQRVACERRGEALVVPASLACGAILAFVE